MSWARWFAHQSTRFNAPERVLQVELPFTKKLRYTPSVDDMVERRLSVYLVVGRIPWLRFGFHLRFGVG